MFSYSFSTHYYSVVLLKKPLSLSLSRYSRRLTIYINYEFSSHGRAGSLGDRDYFIRTFDFLPAFILLVLVPSDAAEDEKSEDEEEQEAGHAPYDRHPRGGLYPGRGLGRRDVVDDVGDLVLVKFRA